MIKDKTGSSSGKHNADMNYQTNNIIIIMNNTIINSEKFWFCMSDNLKLYYKHIMPLIFVEGILKQSF